jgi:hypothetical protein
VLIVSTGVAACGAHRQKTTAPTVAAVVEIPEVTPDQLKAFDSDKSALPAARPHVATTAKSVPGERYVDLDDPWRSMQQVATPHGGPDCVAAALCCEKMMQQSHAGPSAMKMCDTIRQEPDYTCRQFLYAISRAVAQGKTGVSCP